MKYQCDEEGLSCPYCGQFPCRCPSLADLAAMVEETIKIKQVVLQLLHSQGVIAFDAAKTELEPEWEKLKKGEG